MCDDVKSVAGAYEHPAKPSKMAHQWKGYSITPFTAAFLALLAEQYELKKRCEALNLKSQCFSVLAAVAK